MKGKVCFLVTEHPFLDARIFHREAKSLVFAGYEVTMIVPRKQGFLFEPSGSLLTESFLEQSFIHDGVRFITYEQDISHRSNALQLYYLNTNKIDSTPGVLRELALTEKADIYHAHEFDSCYDALMTKRSLQQAGNRCRVIYDSHELDLDTRDSSVSQKRKNLMKKLLTKMCEELDAVVTVSPLIESVFYQLNCGLRTVVLYNAPTLSLWSERKQEAKPLVLGYVGKMEEQKGSLSKLCTILHLTEDIQLKVKVIGGPTGSPQSVQNRLEYTGWLNYEKLHEALHDVDIGWIDVDVSSSLNRDYSLPNKLFTYLERGIPILVNKSQQMETFIQEHRCGFLLNQTDGRPEDYANALKVLDKNRELLKASGLNGRKVMEKSYSWQHMQARLITLYEELLAND